MSNTLSDKSIEVLRKIIANAGRYAQSASGIPYQLTPGTPLPIRNNTNEVVPAYACLRIENVEIVNDNRFIIVVGKPNGTGGPFLFNGERELDIYGNAQFGNAQAGPIVLALVDDAADADLGQFWGPDDDWSCVENGEPALFVYGQARDKTEQLLLIGNTNLPIVQRIGKTDSTITDGSSGVVSLWDANADTGANITAHLDWMTGSEDISSGTEVLITWFPIEGKWRITGADCE